MTYVCFIQQHEVMPLDFLFAQDCWFTVLYFAPPHSPRYYNRGEGEEGLGMRLGNRGEGEEGLGTRLGWG